MRSGSAMAAASASAARPSASAGGSTTSDDDIDASVALNHVVTLEPQARIGRAFAGLELVLPAVPGADDMRLVLVVGLAEIALVRAVELDHLVPDQALAGRAALMQAMIAVGVVGAAVPVDPDLDPVLADDADIAILHFDFIADKNLRHPAGLPPLGHDLEAAL